MLKNKNLLPGIVIISVNFLSAINARRKNDINLSNWMFATAVLLVLALVWRLNLDRA